MTLSASAHALSEAQRTLKALEGSIEAETISMLCQAASDLAQACESLERVAGREWLTPEQARAHLAGRTKKQWEAISPHLPKHYLSPGVALYSRSEIDRLLEYATTPGDAVAAPGKPDNKQTTKDSQNIGIGRNTGAARSLQNALRRG